MNMGPLQSLNTPSPGSDPTYVSTKYEREGTRLGAARGAIASRCRCRTCASLPGHSMDTALWIGAAAALVTAITALLHDDAFLDAGCSTH